MISVTNIITIITDLFHDLPNVKDQRSSSLTLKQLLQKLTLDNFDPHLGHSLSVASFCSPVTSVTFNLTFGPMLSFVLKQILRLSKQSHSWPKSSGHSILYILYIFYLLSACERLASPVLWCKRLLANTLPSWMTMV